MADVYKSTSMKIYAWLKMILVPYEQITRFVPQNGKVLDIGCGYGILSIFLALESVERKILGIDLNRKRINAIDEFVSNLPENVEFENTEIESMGQTKFDCVIMEEILHHIPRKEQQGVLNTINEILKDDGYFILRDNNKRWSLRYIFVNLPAEYLLYATGEKANFRSNSEFIEMLDKANFSCEVFQAPWYSIIDVSLFKCKKKK